MGTISDISVINETDYLMPTSGGDQRKGEHMNLRDYQQECIDILDRTKSGSHLVVMATGLGKTVTMAGMKRKGRVLILSHRDELVHQPARYFNCSFGFERAEEVSNGEDVVSASVQSLCKDARLSKFDRDAFETIIIDEAHHAAAPTYRKILNYFHPNRVFGFTATPKRGDKVRLDDIFKDIIFSRDVMWGVEHNWLAPVRAMRICTDADISTVNIVGGDYQEGAIAEAIEQSNAIITAANAYVKKCHESKRQTLIYCPTVKICHLLKETICGLLPQEAEGTVCVITGATDEEERREKLSAYQTGSIRCIINCMVLTEGFDAPSTNAIVVMRPTCNDSLYQQMVGRGLRTNDGKENCLVLDIVPSMDSVRHYICTAPSLFGEDAAFATKHQQQMMEEEYDLMEMVSVIRRNVEKNKQDILSLHLFQEEFNIFAAEQVEDILEKKVAEPPKELAKYHVRLNPGAEERYSIAFANGCVTISEPDVIGQVDVHITVGDDLYLTRTNLNGASEIAKRLCYVHYSPTYLWNEDIHKEWDQVDATSAQMYRIRHTAWHETVSQKGTLTKAQASDLIDLDVRIKKKREDMTERGILYKPAKAKKTQEKREQQALEAYKQLQAEKEERQKEGREKFDSFSEKLKNQYQTIGVRNEANERIKAQEKKSWLLDQPKWIRTTISNERYNPSERSKPSERQLDFIYSLIQQLRCMHVLFDNEVEKPQTECEASAAITTLLYLKDQIPSSVKSGNGKMLILVDTATYVTTITSAKPYVVNINLRLYRCDNCSSGEESRSS